MKNFLTPSLAFFAAISILSCSNSNDSIENSVDQNTETVAKSSNSPQTESNELTKTLLGNNFITNYGGTISRSNKENAIADFKAIYKKAPVIHGPYTISIPVPSPSLTEQKVTYAQVGNTYPVSGVYFADIYSYFMKVQLPSNAVTGWVESIDNPGYANYTTQALGFNQSFATENGNKFVVGNTYTMVLKYNMVGQLVNAVVPAASGAKTFTYFYLTT